MVISVFVIPIVVREVGRSHSTAKRSVVREMTSPGRRRWTPHPQGEADWSARITHGSPLAERVPNASLAVLARGATKRVTGPFTQVGRRWPGRCGWEQGRDEGQRSGHRQYR